MNAIEKGAYKLLKSNDILKNAKEGEYFRIQFNKTNRYKK
jgi:hypothetical protein